MKQYFEFQEDASSKFWEITLENNIVKTRYGKIGTEGKSTEKEFSDAAAASKEYDKLVKEKTKKGYQEITQENTPSAEAPRVLTMKQAKEQFDLSGYDPMGDIGYDAVLLFDGDTHVDSDLQEWAKKITVTLGDKAKGMNLFLINGNLTVIGDLDITSHLLVLGNVTCDVLMSYDECIHITGDANIKYAFDGNYNDGSITIEGTTYVPYVLNSDHSSTITPEGAILINYFGDSNDFFDYDYTEQDFERIMVPEVFDEKMRFKQHKFVELLKEGKSPLKEDARPARQVLEEEMEQLAKDDSGGIEEVDMTDKRLNKFPLSVTEIISLKKLILNDNPIKSIPADIEKLVNLEELQLESCYLESLDFRIEQLKKLKVLNISSNYDLPVPEGMGKLASLKTLNIARNGFEWLEPIGSLKKLEELDCSYSTDAAPVDFPVVITQLTGLKKLFIGSNSVRTIPESILQLENLEELDLDSSLCYLDELPDLSKLKKLKILHADGQRSNSTRPYPKQSLLQSFFNIPGLEELYIDRFGKEEEAFLNKDQFAEIEKNLAHDPERFKAFADTVSTIVPNSIYGDGRKGITRHELTAAHLEGISKLKHLKVLNLSFNGLINLPEEIFTMKNLQFLDLRYNRLATAERLKISKNLPGCTIDFRDNRPVSDVADAEEVKQWQMMNMLMMRANTFMVAKDDAKRLGHSLVAYDQVLELFRSGQVVDEYNLLYANYGKVNAYNYLLSNHAATFSPAELLENRLAAIDQGLKTLELVPVIIWHFTDLGAFHKDVTRISANMVAWQMYEIYDKTEDLEKALDVIVKGVECISNEDHYFIYDTKVRILLKLGRTEEAWQIVKRTLTLSPDFNDFQDLKKDERYKKWKKKNK
ncbi:WGR domain-containing protein, predicted DNA-binding domain in MolR [Chitinophaga sp. YR573]|uniref:leucine-rich repeat domain-containing protein n=1 Tax=Chitinophaga sp. YR573 TaxID=1881040 RepID=UPI0008CDC980|nr:leucine-rich repeat domain-containing protein [Chitinophaga sp. YR573]SEW34543.1 WGR domain-containing protein, predicted DNA-binding domain in MolR [Chitinophaga sp. YR573]